MKKIVYGRWDVSQIPFTLGGILVFASELLTLKDHLGASVIKVASSDPAKLSLYRDIDGIDEICGLDQLEGVLWEDIFSSVGGNTLRLQSFHRQYGNIHRLQMKSSLRSKARNFLQQYRKTELVISVHLKNNAQCTHCSNANSDEWFAFFQLAAQYPVTFFLISNDIVDPRIGELPNVICGMSGSLSLDLTIIGESDAFMGMASGPCNIAMLGTKPYAIFKDPDHHEEEMNSELGERNYFTFAQPHQHIYRATQNAMMFMVEFKNLYSTISRN